MHLVFRYLEGFFILKFNCFSESLLTHGFIRRKSNLCSLVEVTSTTAVQGRFTSTRKTHYTYEIE